MMKTFFLLPLLLLTMATQMQAQKKSTIILVHGAGHGSWCWSKLIPILAANHVNSIAIDLPGQSNDTAKLTGHLLADDAIAIKNLANSISEKVILVGHSSGGVAIALAAEWLGKDKVDKLIFLDAFMPSNGESVRDLAAQAYRQSKPSAAVNPAPTQLFTADHTAFRWNPDIVVEHFYHDCSKDDVDYAKAHLVWQSVASIASPAQLSDSVYGNIPKYYILCTLAKDLDKHSIANNVPVKKIFEIPSSHSPFFSMPAKLADILLTIYQDK